jgi:hypothetical protein
MVGGRVAILGGDGRNPERWAGLGEVEVYKAPRDGGNGELRRLESAIKAGGIARVLVIARFNAHSGMKKLRRTCRTHGVGMVVMVGAGQRWGA